MVSRFKDKFATMFILSGVCIQTSFSICVIERDLDQMECLFYSLHFIQCICGLRY